MLITFISNVEVKICFSSFSDNLNHKILSHNRLSLFYSSESGIIRPHGTNETGNMGQMANGPKRRSANRNIRTSISPHVKPSEFHMTMRTIPQSTHTETTKVEESEAVDGKFFGVGPRYLSTQRIMVILIINHDLVKK